MGIEAISVYGFLHIGIFNIVGNAFEIHVSDKNVIELEKCIYAFVVEDKFIRIGSSKAPLKSHLAAWKRDVSKALEGKKSGTPIHEAETWRHLLIGNKNGILYARQGTIVVTPIGPISAYLDEESTLIGRYLPALNHNKHR